MPISVVCSGCDKKLKVKEEAAGKKVRCPGCSEVISVPKLAEPEIDELDDFEEEDDDFEVRKPKKRSKRGRDDEMDFDDGEMDLGDELPVRSKSSGKGSKKGKGKAKSRSGPWQGFLLEMYEGELNRYLTYAFWGIFGVGFLIAPFGSLPWTIFLGTMYGIVVVRQLIVLYWWAKLCSETSSLGPLIFIAFLFFPIIGLIFACMNNDLCEKPNRMFMFSIGIGVMTLVAAIVAVAIGVSVLGSKLA